MREVIRRPAAKGLHLVQALRALSRRVCPWPSHVAARPCQVRGRAPRSGRGGVPTGSPWWPRPFVDTQKASLANLRDSPRLAEAGHENGGTTPFRCYPRDKSYPHAPVSLPVCGFVRMGGMSSRGYVPETTKNRLKTSEKSNCRDLATGPSASTSEGVIGMPGAV